MKLLAHLLLTFLTGGLWLIVVFVQMARGKKVF